MKLCVEPQVPTPGLHNLYISLAPSADDRAPDQGLIFSSRASSYIIHNIIQPTLVPYRPRMELVWYAWGNAWHCWFENPIQVTDPYSKSFVHRLAHRRLGFCRKCEEIRTPRKPRGYWERFRRTRVTHLLTALDFFTHWSQWLLSLLEVYPFKVH